MRLYKDIDSTRLRLTGSPRGVALSLSLYLSPPVLPPPHPSCFPSSSLRFVSGYTSRTCSSERVLRLMCASRDLHDDDDDDDDDDDEDDEDEQLRVSKASPDGNATSPRRDEVSKSFKVGRRSRGNRRIDRGSLHRLHRHRRRRRRRSPFPLITRVRACPLAERGRSL